MMRSTATEEPKLEYNINQLAWPNNPVIGMVALS